MKACEQHFQSSLQVESLLFLGSGPYSPLCADTKIGHFHDACLESVESEHISQRGFLILRQAQGYSVFIQARGAKIMSSIAT